MSVAVVFGHYLTSPADFKSATAYTGQHLSDSLLIFFIVHGGEQSCLFFRLLGADFELVIAAVIDLAFAIEAARVMHCMGMTRPIIIDLVPFILCGFMSVSSVGRCIIKRC